MITSLAILLLPGYSFNPGSATTPGANPAATAGQVVPHLDEQDKVDVLVPEKGGQVSLTLASGIAFSLDIPKEVLSSVQEIIMTPICSIDGMLLSGGFLAGVELDPEETVLLPPAALTNTVPNGYDRKQMVGIAYHGHEDGFHHTHTPAIGDGKTISLPILSFSGHGAGTWTSASIQQQVAQATARGSQGSRMLRISFMVSLSSIRRRGHHLLHCG